ncbi:MAG: serine/threonine-protein kinase [Candidatus Latescibacteria bacterium]|nr:serine/threonine-protein kinase [Candidatus Latescibacterota bacterium]
MFPTPLIGAAASPESRAMVGQTISHYRITEHLGGGGMGIVYKARDLRLDRFVALKFLPPELTRDSDAKQRFMQEAKAASALDHPNICTIHEIDETSDGHLFIVMAYYPGETLKKTIARGPLSVDDALDIAVQIAQGLAKAHEAHIVHRDIKPANVMFTTDRLVKIVDFGLAKLAGQPKLTRVGTTLGTVAYMSPEQARAEEVDHRTDIWALGVVLYEMITGLLPFRGEHDQALLAAIANADPVPMSGLRTGVPLVLERIVARALAKRTDDRYQTVADLLSEVRRVQRESEDSEKSTVTMPARPGQSPVRATWWSKSWLLAGVAAFVIVAAIFGYLFLRPGETVPRLTRPTQLTATIGVEDAPTWSSDGGRLAYQSDQSGNVDIWVTQVGGGSALNLTADYTGTDVLPSWSPDGREIAFWSDRDDGGYYVVSALGGSPRKMIPGVITGGGKNPPQWSGDGEKLACVVRDTTGLFVEILSLRTGQSQRLLLPGRGTSRFDLNWSPDGRYFTYVETVGTLVQAAQIWVMRAADGKGFPVTDGRFNDRSPTWSNNGRYLYFVSNRGGSMDLWQQRIGNDGKPVGQPQSVTTGIGIRSAIFSRDGTKLAYSKGRKVSNLWRIPIFKGRTATWEDAEQLTFEEAFIEFVDVSPDGRRLLFSWDRSGNQDLWVMPVNDRKPQQLTTDPASDWMSSWSPDGQKIVFNSNRNGNYDLWVMLADGRRARPITQHEAYEGAPDWSPDGRQIVFHSIQSGNFDIRVIPSDGGETRGITVHPTDDLFPQWSPDGKWLAFRSARTREGCLWRVSAMGGDPEQLTEGSILYSRWSPDGKTVYFIGAGERRRNLWMVSLEGRIEQPMTDLVGKTGSLGYALATDGHYLYFTWEEEIGDLWVMDVEKEK